MKKEIEEVIINDVRRPLTKVGAANEQALIRILKAYACYNPAIEYCQGMSYIVEFLFVIIRDEVFTFAFFKTVIENFKMNQLYANELPLLKKLFYQLDRLLFIVKPNLMTYFRNEEINANFFSSAWFMTLFTHTMRNEDEEVDEGLLAIWDTFFLYGWKALFKIAIFALEMVGEKLMERNPDQMMNVIKDLLKADFLRGGEIAREFKRRYKKIEVTNEMLDLLEEEYNSVKDYKVETIITSKGIFHI